LLWTGFDRLSPSGCFGLAYENPLTLSLSKRSPWNKIAAIPFYTYILECADGSFYVGHTDDLSARLGQHQAGSLGGYTATRRPVRLCWSAQFPDRDDAFRLEQQLKGWSRAKKLALMAGEFDRLPALARGRSGPASTSSA
jgi:predicted GIY-YIG superfamily endonuclease